MSDYLTSPRDRKAALGLLAVVVVVAVAFVGFGASAGHSTAALAVFGVAAVLTAGTALLIHRDSPAGWGFGLLVVGLFIWLQFWYTTFSNGQLGRELIGSLNLLTAVSVLALSVLVENRNYYWGPFVEGRGDAWKVGVGIAVAVGLIGVVYFAGATFTTDWRRLGRLALRGLGQGSLYALPTIGFVLVYKVTDVLNFAQGILIVLGAFTVVIFTDWGLSVPAALALSLVAAVALGLFLERFVFRRFVGEPELSYVLVTIALISVIGGVVEAIVGGRLYFGYPDAILLESVMLPFGFDIRGSFAIGIVASLVILAALVAFFKYTVLGAGLRAAAADQQAAVLLGISISQATKIAWVLSIAITIIGGILIGMSLGGATFNFEIIIVLIFAAAIFGGLDSLIGAYIGSIAVGTLEVLGGFYYTPIYGSGFDPVLPMLFLLGVIIVKPYGLLGTERIERL
jgi:branched-chain amino acid transport system permease protein